MGIIVTIVLLFIFPILFKQMKVSGYQYYTAQNIFSRAGLIIKKIMGLGSEGFGTFFNGSAAPSTSTSTYDTPSGSL